MEVKNFSGEEKAPKPVKREVQGKPVPQDAGALSSAPADNGTVIIRTMNSDLEKVKQAGGVVHKPKKKEKAKKKKHEEKAPEPQKAVDVVMPAEKTEEPKKAEKSKEAKAKKEKKKKEKKDKKAKKKEAEAIEPVQGPEKDMDLEKELNEMVDEIAAGPGKKKDKEVLEPAPEVDDQTSDPVEQPAAEESKAPGSSRGVKVALVLMTAVVLLVAGGFVWYKLYIIEDVGPSVPLASNSEPVIPDPPQIPNEPTVPVFSDPFTTHPQALAIASSQFDIDLPDATPISITEMADALTNTTLGTGFHELFFSISGRPASFFSLLDILGATIPAEIVNSFEEVHFFVQQEGAGPRYAAVGVLNSTSTQDFVVSELELLRDQLSFELAQGIGTTVSDPDFTEVEYNGANVVFQNYELESTSFDYAWVPGSNMVLFGTSKDSMLGLIDALNAQNPLPESDSEILSDN